MKILLVNPPPFEITEPYYDTPDYPRTALAYLAGYLREKGIDVDVLDCKYDKLDFDNALKRICALNADVIGFTSFTNEIIQAAQIARVVKAEYRDVTTIVGGVHVSALPEKTMREFPEFDYGIIGEGEETLYELLLALEKKGNCNVVKGLCYVNKDSSFYHTGEREFIRDYNFLPLPAWDLFKPAKEYIIQSSRGCPFKCDFCMNPNGRIVRPRTPGNVLKEINWLVTELGAQKIVFGDENFSIDIKRAIEICELIINSGLDKKFKWDCTSHVSRINHELAIAMKNAGCVSVGLGIESGDERRLKTIGKGTDLKKISSAIEILNKAKLKYRTFFILGQPNETYETAKKTIDFAVKLNPMLPVIGIMVPYPGTRISNLAQNGEGGYILKALNWNDYNKEIGNALEFVHVPRRKLEKLQFIGYIKVFLLNLRFTDLFMFLWKYRKEGLVLLSKIVKKPFRDKQQNRSFI